MKIGVSSYSFKKLIDSKDLAQIDIISKARELGFEAIEFAGLLLQDAEDPTVYAAKIKEECERVGIEITSYTIGADFINGSNGNWEEEVNRLKKEVEIASILGVSSMRHDATWGFYEGYKGQKGFDNALPTLIKGCKMVTEYAAESGIRTMVENHGYFCQDSDRIEKLINGVNHPNFGALIDIANFLCVDEDPGKAVGKLMPYAFHIHVKDFHMKSGMSPNPGQGWFRSRGGNFLRGSIVGNGDVPVKQCLSIIKNSKYNGNFSIEFEGMEDPITGITVGFENLKNYLESLSV